MNNTAVISSGGLREKVKTERKQSALLEKLKKEWFADSYRCDVCHRKCGSPPFQYSHQECNEQLLLRCSGHSDRHGVVYQLDCGDRHYAALSYQDS